VPAGEAAAAAFRKGPAPTMRYERFAPSLAPAGAVGDRPDFLARLRKNPASDPGAPEPLPIGLVAGVQWCRCSDRLQP